MLLAAASAGWGFGREKRPPGAPALAAGETAPRIQANPSCEGDVALAMAARLVYCTSPLGPAHPDKGACLRQAAQGYTIGRTTCSALTIPPAEVALLSPRQIESLKKIDEIEAELLLEPLTPEQQKPLAQEVPPPPPPQAAPPPPPPPPERPRQVVEVTRPQEEQAPEDTQYLSQYNSRVSKQTVARGSTEEMAERPDPAALTPKPTPREPVAAENPDEPAPSVAQKPDAPQGPGKLAMRNPGPPELLKERVEAKTPGAFDGSDQPLSANALTATRGNSPTREEAREATRAPLGDDGGGGGRPAVPNLRATEEILERMVGGGSVDKIDDAESGDVTALNTRAWKHASFFNRMARQVAQNWQASEIFSRRDPHGNVYGIRDRVTVLHVSLTPQGEVKALVVVQSSGVDFLDEEAMRAFRAAQPFPNPPQALVDAKTQLISFAFTFHLENSERNSWRLLR